jgi:ubiquinone biosynthesis protein
VFVDGFFHGDPHAGNILCDAEGTLCMIDLGLVGTLSEEQRGDVVALMLATFANDSASTARLLLKMGTPTQRVNLAELKAEVERIRAKYLAQKAVGDVDSSGFVQEFAHAAQQFRIKLASEYAILIKSVATLEGIVRSLHPTVDMVGIARPYVQQTLARRLSPQLLMREFASEAGLLGSLAQRLPGQVDQLLHDFETGNLQVRAVTPELDALPLTLHQAASRLSLSLFATAMALCSALLLPGGFDDVPRLVLSIALGLASATAWLVLLGWHFVRGRPLRITPLLRLFRRG